MPSQYLVVNGVQREVQSRTTRIVLTCIFHPEHRPSLNVYRTNAWFRCYSCGKHGIATDHPELLELLDLPPNLSRPEEQGEKRVRVYVPTPKSIVKKTSRQPTPIRSREAPPARSYQPAVEYRRRRS